MGNDSDTETKINENDKSNYISFETLQESLNLSNPKIFKKYLHEVFLDLSNLPDSKNIKYISPLSFYDYIKLPIFISDKLFKSFKSHNKDGLLEKEFVNGFYQLYMGSFEETTTIIFNLLDFDKDSLIQKEDIKLILTYLILNNFNNNCLNENNDIIYDKQMKKMNEINDLVNKTFKKNNINMNEFIDCLKKKKSDIYLDILCFLYNKKPFSAKSLECLKSKYMNDEEYQETSQKYISLRSSFRNLIKTPTKQNNEIVNKMINKKYNLSPKSSGKIVKEMEIDDSFHKYESTPVKGHHHRYGSCGVNEEIKNKINKEKKEKLINSPLLSNISSDNNIYNDNDNINYENYIYKISDNNKISKFYLLLINNDIFYFKEKDKKELIGMHNLSSCFIKEYNNKGEKTIDNNIYYSFSIFFKSNSKIRKFYTSNLEIYNEFVSNLKKIIGHRDFLDYYTIEKEIGIGRNSHVNLGVQKDTGKLVTIKIIDKQEDETKKEEELVRYEIGILKFCHHKNIVNLIDYFETIDNIIIILNYIEGNTLGEYLKNNNFNFTETQVANIVLQIAKGIKYLHKFGIIHRDLKTDNIMIEQKNTEVKIMDFGLSKIASKEEKLIEGYGTLYYAAPEIIENLPYNKEVDIWSLGVILYYIFTGCYPFMGKEEDEIEEKIINEPVEFKDGEWEVISDKVQDLIKKCLEKNPEGRITIDDFINHPWFNNILH